VSIRIRGVTRAMRVLLSGAVSKRSIDYWMAGRRAPDWAVERVLLAIEARCGDGLAIARQLRTELERRRLGLDQPRRGGGIGRAMMAPERLLGGPEQRGR
jgi:hypothetical protein